MLSPNEWVWPAESWKYFGSRDSVLFWLMLTFGEHLKYQGYKNNLAFTQHLSSPQLKELIVTGILTGLALISVSFRHVLF